MCKTYCIIVFKGNILERFVILTLPYFGKLEDYFDRDNVLVAVGPTQTFVLHRFPLAWLLYWGWFITASGLPRPRAVKGLL